MSFLAIPFELYFCDKSDFHKDLLFDMYFSIILRPSELMASFLLYLQQDEMILKIKRTNRYVAVLISDYFLIYIIVQVGPSMIRFFYSCCHGIMHSSSTIAARYALLHMLLTIRYCQIHRNCPQRRTPLLRGWILMNSNCDGSRSANTMKIYINE